jgi:predicted nucleotidyltransferase component of viral defense system
VIPKDFITEWRDRAPWVSDRQVEQDLVVSRALVALFSRPTIANALAFRGGTALYKLHFRPAARYSEDIDLVQTEPGGIGPALDAIHDALDGWLGKPQWKQSEGRVTLNYRFESEDLPPVRSKLKVEINSREHFTVYGLKNHRFDVSSRWFSGAADVRTYELDELLGTKLRALYQRKKGRDLFDLGLALSRDGVSPRDALLDGRPGRCARTHREQAWRAGRVGLRKPAEHHRAPDVRPAPCATAGAGRVTRARRGTAGGATPGSRSSAPARPRSTPSSRRCASE